VFKSQVVKKILPYVGAFISLIIVCAALWVMNNTLKSIQISDVIDQLKEISAASLILALLITCVSYLIVTGYDVVALDHVRRRVPYSRAALSAFLASTFGNNIGFAILTGTSIRYRVYSQVGLSAMDIAGVSTMCALTTTLGMSVIFAVAMVLQTGDVATTGIPIPPAYLRFVGASVLAVIIGYLIVSSLRPLSIRAKSWSLRLPNSKTTILQILLATTNLSLVATLIYVLLPDGTDVSYIAFLSVFALALIAGSASNVPGGIGVFESVILVGLPEIPPAALLGSILLFRCIYYLSPLAVASILLVYNEASAQRQRIERAQDSLSQLLDELGPQIMANIQILAGVILLFSGSIPTGFDRLESSVYVPLLIVELAHLLGAAAGVGLLINARGIARRLSSSFDLALKLLALGIVTSLLKGFGYREALVLGVLLALLWRARPAFYRKGTVFDEGFPADWVSLLTAVVAVTIWLGLFSFKGTPYSMDLWWTFSYNDDYSRFLRSTLLVLVIIGVVTAISLLRHDPEPGVPEAEILDHIRGILANEHNPRANLVLLGDKRILFSDSGNAFIMYQTKGRSWVALCDPVGPAEEHRDLIWKFHGLCDRYGAWPAFYLIDDTNFEWYRQIGLSTDKLGDDAMMPLADFSLDGAVKSELQEVHARVRKQGVRMEWVESSKVPRMIEELKLVSDDWLSHCGKTEMGFSRGMFDPYYVVNFPCVVVRQKSRIVAFAVILPSPDKGDEMALDLMRYRDDAPKNIIDYLIIELLLTGRQKGYRWINLGMAPLSGLQQHPLAPLWHRVGVLMYRQSGLHEDFDSIRNEDKKFNPTWRPKYIAYPGGVKSALVLRDVARLVVQPKFVKRSD